MKTYTLTVEVDIDTLIAAYTGGDDSIQMYDLPSMEEIIEFECKGWLPSSGIHIVDVIEVEE